MVYNIDKKEIPEINFVNEKYIDEEVYFDNEEENDLRNNKYNNSISQIKEEIEEEEKEDIEEMKELKEKKEEDNNNELIGNINENKNDDGENLENKDDFLVTMIGVLNEVTNDKKKRDPSKDKEN